MIWVLVCATPRYPGPLPCAECDMVVSNCHIARWLQGRSTKKNWMKEANTRALGTRPSSNKKGISSAVGRNLMPAFRLPSGCPVGHKPRNHGCILLLSLQGCRLWGWIGLLGHESTHNTYYSYRVMHKNGCLSLLTWQRTKKLPNVVDVIQAACSIPFDQLL